MRAKRWNLEQVVGPAGSKDYPYKFHEAAIKLDEAVAALALALFEDGTKLTPLDAKMLQETLLAARQMTARFAESEFFKDGKSRDIWGGWGLAKDIGQQPFTSRYAPHNLSPVSTYSVADAEAVLSESRPLLEYLKSSLKQPK